MSRVRIFDHKRYYTTLHNALFDVVMPNVSGNAWKLICLIVRQTKGWDRDDVGMSYRDLLAGLGVASRATVASAIKELEPFNLLETSQASEWEETHYRLNLDADIEWEPVNFGQPVTKNGTASVTKNVTSPVTENGTAPVTETVLFNKKEEREKREKKGALAFSPDGNPFTPETSVSEHDLLADQLFNALRDGCSLPPILTQAIEKRINNAVISLIAGKNTAADVQAFIANWRRTKTIALTPERVASDIGEWRRLNTSAAPTFEVPPRPDTKGMTVAAERRALAEWFSECQRIKQQAGVAA